jgi:hypothetical protein
MMRISFKAQAAMEFLTTYGWALLILGVVFAAFSLGLFQDPRNIVSDTCTFIEGFNCKDFEVLSDGTVHLSLVNYLGEQITTTRTACTYNTVTKNGPSDVTVGPSGSFQLTIYCLNSGTFPMKDKVKLNIDIIYKEQGKQLEKVVSGTVVAKPK